MSDSIAVKEIGPPSISGDGKIVSMQLTFQNGGERTYALPSKELATFIAAARRDVWAAGADQAYAALPSNLKFHAREDRHSLLISFNLSETLPIEMEVRLQDLARLKQEMAKLS